jgi:hypothetical protein
MVDAQWISLCKFDSQTRATPEKNNRTSCSGCVPRIAMFAEIHHKGSPPNILKAPILPATTASVASTTYTISSSFKASYGDLASLEAIEPMQLPRAAFEYVDPILEEEDQVQAGARLGKFCAKRMLSREMSIDSVVSDDMETPEETVELLTRLLFEADRISRNTGCHVKVQKLTTSRTSPYKTLLRHPPLQ